MLCVPQQGKTFFVFCSLPDVKEKNNHEIGEWKSFSKLHHQVYISRLCAYNLCENICLRNERKKRSQKIFSTLFLFSLDINMKCYCLWWIFSLFSCLYITFMMVFLPLCIWFFNLIFLPQFNCTSGKRLLLVMYLLRAHEIISYFFHVELFQTQIWQQADYMYAHMKWNSCTR